MYSNNNIIAQLQQKLSDGEKTMYVYIEESTDYDTVKVNVSEMLKMCKNINSEYCITARDSDMHYGDSDTVIFCLSYNGDYIEHGSTSNVVFFSENECINFCSDYLIDLRFSEDVIISKTEAISEVIKNSNNNI